MEAVSAVTGRVAALCERGMAVYERLLCHVPALGMVLSYLEGRSAGLVMLFFFHVVLEF